MNKPGVPYKSVSILDRITGPTSDLEECRERLTIAAEKCNLITPGVLGSIIPSGLK